VGAAFDFHAGTKSQAPSWMQAIGLEWFFRLIHEPAAWPNGIYITTRVLSCWPWQIYWYTGKREKRGLRMLRRFSINFAIFSMVLDAFWVVVGLKAAELIRPFLDGIPFLKSIPEQVDLHQAFTLFSHLSGWRIFSHFAIYDGRKFLRRG